MIDPSQMTRAELVAFLRALESRRAEVRTAHGRNVRARPPSAQTALADSEERLRAILATAVEGIITIDERGMIESVNPAAERIFGYPSGELVGRSVTVLMPPPDSEEHNRHLARYLRTGKAGIIGVGREATARRKDGVRFPIELSVSEVKLANRRLFTGVVRDVTVRKRTEEKLALLAQRLAEKNRELEAIMYAASHDLRSPLVNIQGFSKELGRACDKLNRLLRLQTQAPARPELKRLLSGEIPEALQYIQAGVGKIDSLLAGFLRYSRLGHAALNVERLNMNSMLAEIARTMEFQIKRARATLRIAPLPDCLGDATQVNQVFSNLLDNAVKYLDPKRRGRISVTGETVDDRSFYTVRDNGIGIPPEHQEKIFEIFHRLNPSKVGGEGLGLTIARRILERQDGTLRVQSEPGKGAAFLVSLPRPASAR